MSPTSNHKVIDELHEAAAATPLPDSAAATLADHVHAADDYLEELDTQFRDVVRHNPLASLVVAFAGGYVLGRILAKR